MVMTMHVLHAGDGYTYLTRSVASADQQRGRGTSLSDYYAANGTPPGQWTGRGLADLTAFGSPEGESGLVGGAVTEAQMRALFGEGLHPNADQLIDAGADVGDTRLGRRFPLYANAPSPFLKDFAAATKAFEAGQQRRPDAAERDQMWMRAAREHYELAHPNKVDPSEQAVRAWAGRQRAATRQPVAGYDLTFTPVKSVSVLWSLGDEDTRRTIEACHREAADESIRYLEDNALVTRRGGKGEAQIDAGGLVIAAFDHYDNRDGEPNLHTHYAVSNKVLGSDGRWSSIDGTPWFKAASTASARYNAALADKLTDRLGVEFRSRSKGADKEPVLEIAGITDTRIASHAGRTATIEQRYAELEADYIDRHQRAPGRAARYQLRQKANLDTRRAKAALATGSAADRGDGAAVVHGLGATLERARKVDVAAHPDAARGRALLEHCQAEAARLTDFRADTARLSVDELADLTTAKLEQRFNSWSPTTVTRWATIVVAQQATEGTLPDGVARADLIEQVTAAVTRDSLRIDAVHPVLDTSTGLIPEAMQRRNGEHILTPVGSTLLTSTRVVESEHNLILASETVTSTVATDAAVKAAIAAVGEETGFALNEGQARLVEHFCSSGALLAVGVGPAGTGKTTSMKATIAAWENTTGLPQSVQGRKVIALAPSAAAAMKLGDELGMGTSGDPADAARTIDTEVVFFTANMKALAAAREAGDTTQVKRLRERMTRRIPRGSMLLVDEAGMASTANLHEILRIAKATGSVVRLLGDPLQLDAVDRGGALELLAKHTDAPTLTKVVRFVQSERAADGTLAAATTQVVEDGVEKTVKKGLDTIAAENSLRMRDGHHDSLTMFDERGWTHHHSAKEAALTDVVAAHLADQQRGSNAMVVATTRADVKTLNEMLQAHHRETGTDRTDRTVSLSDGLTAGRGDIIVTRDNIKIKRRGGSHDRMPIANGELWTVEKIDRDGGITARNIDDGGRIELPADYLRANTELGYALTIHRSQGATVDTLNPPVGLTVSRRRPSSGASAR
ncbi:TrwC relaxase OS=Tsukamurella paurometabola (strain ATCC 8368 / DSM / CCUG 35730 / CIP 100753/ JCM 10117 / KCTC 9821 / NBRC 16120 / NCIMB 702349 / NCTC 13040) OX=521096 GN=Tpau_4256 PE=4 SV=1 [Tsukamurella paurometabola]|uniref:TrwC relaxase n=1 Tax=Tsukamurella paurometabola (strain ATCC 8368 / DSM 20162 / CCUG 35730 / CIP 100753 / JCM 10117 / KCTC 9821 / NBRC 16120 / NCIMB 702349 / NCTC 13040) TaxID=521096 RepID=D5UYX7_TSUPD|nr:TrwC relaxase [Tsukamurella paurometabola DSM 20162]